MTRSVERPAVGVLGVLVGLSEVQPAEAFSAAAARCWACDASQAFRVDSSTGQTPAGGVESLLDIVVVVASLGWWASPARLQEAWARGFTRFFLKSIHERSLTDASTPLSTHG